MRFAPAPPGVRHAALFALWAALTTHASSAGAAPAPAPASTPGDTTSASANEEPPPPPTNPKLPGLGTRPAAAADLRPPAALDQRRTWLKTALDEVFNAPAFSSSKVGVLVIEAETGKVLYARNDKTALNAASNVKIVTSASALALLGPEYRWKTIAYAAGPPKGPFLGAGGEISGDLFIRGFGDPTLTTQDLNAFASDLLSLGVRRIKGGITVDETFFEGGHLAPAYDQRLESTIYRPASSAASLNANVVRITVVPGPKPGAPARILVNPPSPYFTMSGRIVTASSGPAAALVDTKEDSGGRTQIVVSGRVRLGSDVRTYLRRVVNPPLYLGHTLKLILEKRGIAVAGGVKLGQVPQQGMRILSSNDSPPLGVVSQELNKRSNNFIAEQVVRTLGAEIIGRPGSWDKGLEAIGRYLNTLGVRKGAYQMANGSGLYDSNRFSAEQMVAVLRGAMRDFRIAAEFMASLAIAGMDGTIAHRMAGTAAERFVRAKTGTLATASCLSGYAGSPGRAPLIFSILMNDVPSPGDARRAQDRAAELLVSYIEAGS